MSDLWERSPALLVSWCVWVIGSIVLHELGHGFAATWQGDTTPRAYGRLTLNPVTHMGVPSLICFAIFGFAWGAMPVDPRQFRWGRWGDVLVSFAGPLVNIVLAVIALVAAAIYVTQSSEWGQSQQNVHSFLLIGGSINVFLAMFNMLPIPPLDGAAVLGGLHPALYRFYSSDTVRNYGGLALLVLFAAGIGGSMFQVSNEVTGMLANRFETLFGG